MSHKNYTLSEQIWFLLSVFLSLLTMPEQTLH